MHVGLHVPNFTWSDDQGQLGDTFATIARRAERAGFYSLWVMDHFFQISLNGPAEHEMLEGWSALAFVAGVHALTALKKALMRHQDVYATDTLRDSGTTNLLAAAREVGARKFVVESMTMGYGYGDWGEKVITEDCPFAPAGKSSQLERHLAALRSLARQIWEATQAGWIEGISLRYGNFYGSAPPGPIVEILRR